MRQCDANCKMPKRKIGAVCGTALLIAAAVVVALRERLQPVPDVPVAQTPAEVRVKEMGRKTETVEQHIWTLLPATRTCASGDLPRFAELWHLTCRGKV